MQPGPSPTAEPSPLVIARIAATPAAGWLSIGPCPGRRDENRDLAADLGAIRASGATMLITLTTQDELDELAAGGMAAANASAGLDWHHLPISDFGVPDAAWETRWRAVGADLRALLRAGGGIHLHCRGGCGRSGMIAARLLAELGVPPEEAITRVRAARPCAIETEAQEAAVRAIFHTS